MVDRQRLLEVTVGLLVIPIVMDSVFRESVMRRHDAPIERERALGRSARERILFWWLLPGVGNRDIGFCQLAMSEREIRIELDCLQELRTASR